MPSSTNKIVNSISSVKNTIPLIATLFGSVLVLSLAVFFLSRLDRWAEIGIAVITLAVYFLWMKWESKISIKELEKSTQDFDCHTMELAAVAKIVTLTLSLAFTNTVIVPAACFGYVIMLWGIKLRTSGIKALGEHYSHRIRIPEVVIQTGIYAKIRHPSYAGTFLIHLGVVLVFFNIYALLSLTFLWGGVVLARTVLEEKVLQKLNAYKQYSQMTRYRLIYGVW